MTKIEPIGICGLHRGLTIPEIYIENTKLHDEVNGLRKQRRKAREKIKKLQQENQQLKKQKDDVIDWLNNNYCYVGNKMTLKPYSDLNDLLRMLGEIE